jgi:hypothetical protein
MSNATAGTRVVNGVTFFTTAAGKELAVMGRVPRTQFNYLLALSGAKLNDLKAKFQELGAERVRAFRADIRVLQDNQKHIRTFEQIQAVKQAGAAWLYRKGLATLVKAADDFLGDTAEAEAGDPLGLDAGFVPPYAELGADEDEEFFI